MEYCSDTLAHTRTYTHSVKHAVNANIIQQRQTALTDLNRKKDITSVTRMNPEVAILHTHNTHTQVFTHTHVITHTHTHTYSLTHT